MPASLKPHAHPTEVVKDTDVEAVHVHLRGARLDIQIDAPARVPLIDR
jgi:hypothetical protein